MKKFLLTLIALVMSIGMSWADKTVYLNPAMWDAGGAVFDAYVWNDGGNSWIELSSTVTVDGNKCYKAEIPDTWEKLIFVRQDPNTRGSWDHKWNQTSDLTLADVENKVVTITNWNKSQSISTNAVTSYSVKFATGLDWNPIDAYVWKASGPTFLGDWPGAPMTATDETFTIDGVAKTVYGINILTTLTVAPTNVVFNNGVGGDKGVAQTADLPFVDGKFYFLPTTIPTEPTAYKKKVVVVYSNYFELGLYAGLYNSTWGGGDHTTWSAIDEPNLTNNRKILHVTGNGFAHRLTKSSGRTNDKWVTLDGNSKYTQVHVSVFPKTATTLYVYKDGGWNDTDKLSADVTPGQWNVITLDVPSTWNKNFYCITLMNGEENETEFYLDDFYFTNADSYIEPVQQTLSSIEMPNYIFPAATGQNFNVSPLDANDDDYEDDVTYGITAVSGGADAGSLGTVITGNNIVFGAGGVAGIYRLTGTDENSNSATHNFALVSTGPAAPTADADDVHALYCETYGATTYGDWNPGWEWGYSTRSELTIGGVKCLRIHKPGTYGIPYTADDLTVYKYLKFDVFTINAETNCHVKIEGTNKNNLTFTTNAGVWTPVTIDLEGLEKAGGNKWVDIYFGANNTDNDRDVLIANVYFLKETAPAQKTVTFKNSIGWDNVYAYVADADWNDISAGWPGDEITSTLSWSTTSDDAKWIIFNDGTKQTANLTFADGTEYDYGYYVVGSMNSWAKTDGYAMTRNTYCTSNVEYKLGRQDLTTTSMFKVALWNGVELSTYYPAGMRNSYGEHGEITADDTYNIFFRPNHDGGDDWFEKYIWIGAVGNLEVLGADPTTGAMVLDGTWDGGEFGTLDGTVRATSYDVTNLAATFDGGVINTAKKNALFIARADQNIGKNKVVDNGDGTYTGYNIVILDQSGDNGRDTEMNTQISPITGPVSYTRTLPRAGIYFTMVVPFDVAVPGDCNAYKATTSTSSAGVVNVTFTEVDNLEAGVPYLMHATNGGAAFNVNGLDFSQGGDQALTDGAFKATYAPVNPVPANVYVMPKGDPAVNAEFRLLAGENSYIPAFRAYLQLNGSSSKINVMIEDTDGIHAATAEQLEGIFNIYSIDGKLVRQNSDSAVGLNKGVYIINGKKVVVK